MTMTVTQVLDAETVETRFLDALQTGYVNMHYQPKIDLATGRLVGAEALVRWDDAGAMQAPDSYLPILSTDALAALAQFGVHQVGTDILEFGLNVPIAVNIDPSALERASALVSLVVNVTASLGLDPQMLVLEITEPTELLHRDFTRRKLHELRDMGCRISIDDFGTGHANFLRVRDLPIDELKIDRSISGVLLSEPDMLMLTRNIIALARRLGVACVAEGIEDEPTLVQLRELGCTYGQGFHIGLPMPVEQFALLG
ncbi:MAG: EAL domain-containing protein [Pseudomonadota bacterium]